MTKFKDLKFLADENISPAFVHKCQKLAIDVIHTSQVGLNGKSDLEIANYAIKNVRVILTCDSDFSRIAFTESLPGLGIVYLRPNHINSEHHLETIKHIILHNLDLTLPFILVAELYDNVVRIRLRNNLK